ncbi:MAG TPA: substrate-binding domain-containing protein, partial [Polyangiaceae bacterium]
RGVTVPDPVAVVGFDDAESARAANQPLTTVSQRIELQAHTAATALFEAIAQKRPPVGKKLDPELVLRASCGCVFRFHNDSAEVRLTGSGMARSAALSLVERRSTIAAELARAAAGRLAGMSGWESRLIDALIHDLGHASEQSFVYEIEQFSRKNVALGRSVMVCHDVLTALRLQAVATASLEPAVRPRIEDLFQEARMRLARVGSEVEHERQQSLNHHVRTVTKACLDMLAGSDASKLDDALSEHLPALGIKAYIVSRLEKTRAGERFTLVARYAENTLTRTLLQVPARDLGIDPALEREEVLVVEPLEFAGTPVGVAALSWGAHTPVHYEALREVLSAAIFAVSRTGTSLLQP